MAAVPEGDLLAGIEPGPDGKIDVLTVFAHQDDESVYGGGALLLLKRDPRVRLHMLCMTLGDRSEAKDRLGIAADELARMRVEELETAAAVYGAEQVIQFGYHDQGLASAGREELAERLWAEMDRTGAELVITHDPGGITGHPDHVMTSAAATDAFSLSKANRLYYVTWPRSLYRLPYSFSGFRAKAEPARPTLRVNIRGVKRLKKLAMYSHASQRHFSGVGPLMKIVGLFNYEYFALAAEHP